MQAIKCELCGSNQLIKKDGYYQCEYCGTKYTLEEARKLIVSGTVEVVKGNAEKERILENAETFLKIGQIDKAIAEYYKITENYPNEIKGWEGLLLIIVKYGQCISHQKRKETNDIEKTNDIEELAFEFNKCFNVCKVLNPNISKQYYSDIFFNNLKNGSVVFSVSREFGRYKDLLPMIEKQLAVILNIEQVKYILDCSEKYIRAVNNLGVRTNFCEESEHPIGFLFGSVLIEYYLYDGWISEWVSYSFVTKKIADEQLIFDFETFETLKTQRKNNGLCQHCGGKFKGLFKQVCSKCGKPKDY